MFYYQRIRYLRQNADINQAEIAKVLGVHKTQYSRWERGEQEIPFHHMITLAKFYRCSIDYIAGLTNKKNP